jgi:drug/metabolite transporter (DMT)-like permease
MRRFLGDTGLSGIAFAFGYIGPAAAFMVLLSPLILAEPMQLTLPVVASIIALGVLGTGIAYVWNQNTLRAWGPTRASTVTYITPVVGVALGILILGERISWNEPVGAAVVFLGILLVQQRLRLSRRSEV